jgi:protein-tyrosine phosphatase
MPRSRHYWVPGPWKGRVAIVPRPRGGDWLADEVGAWYHVGFTTVVCALTGPELTELNLLNERKVVEDAGLRFVHVPIPDRGTPSSPCSIRTLMLPVHQDVSGGGCVAVHCRQGIGRSSMLAASLLTWAGVSIEQAIDTIRTARGCEVPETSDQLEWIRQFATFIRSD